MGKAGVGQFSDAHEKRAGALSEHPPFRVVPLSRVAGGHVPTHRDVLHVLRDTTHVRVIEGAD